MGIPISLLPLNMHKLEGVRRIYFGIPVPKGILSRLVGIMALHVGAVRTCAQHCGTGAAMEIQQHPHPSP